MQKAVRSIPLVLFLAVACGGDLESEDSADIEYGTSVHKLPWRDQAAPTPQATTP